VVVLENAELGAANRFFEARLGAPQLLLDPRVVGDIDDRARRGYGAPLVSLVLEVHASSQVQTDPLASAAPDLVHHVDVSLAARQ